MIYFKYNPFKAVQAVALFLKLQGVPVNYMKLLKLLYMSDRMALQSNDESIFGDKYYSMNFGPVLSHIYNLIKGEGKEESQDVWDTYISRRNPNYQQHKDYNIYLLRDPGISELSEEEEDLIGGVYSLFGRLDRFYLAELTHQYFPEWHYPNGGAVQIKVEDILKNVGKSPEEIDQIQMEVEQENYIDRVLAE